MRFLTGNFLNAVDRDRLRGGPLDSVLLSASDKARLELSGSSASMILCPNNPQDDIDYLCGPTHFLARWDTPFCKKPTTYYTLRNIWADICMSES